MPPKSDSIKEWIEESLDRHAEGEGAEYECGFTLSADRGPVYAIFVWLPGAILGTYIYRGIQMNNPAGIDPMKVDEAIAAVVEDCRRARSAQLAEANQHDHPAEGPPED